ncbi:MAG: serine/threonine protein kinase [Verrucomicrobia bacterium]|nr:serine/threonine protein kinase [Verrucomicrobiota bacterium]
MDERYEIREQIGKGGGGLVFRGYDTFLKRDVAIKRILDADSASEEEVKAAARNLLGEAQTLSTLNHPNIVTVFDVGMDEKGGFVVMELLDGETLYDTVDRGVMTQEDFVELAIQSMEALIAAHAVNVMHRDLKPTNVMVIWQPSGRFQTKILDFGLAKFSKKPSVQTLNQDGTVMGSILFMAPEQFERQELDDRTDLYSMGCVYYQSLSGNYPYDGESSADVMNSHLDHRVTPLEVLRPDLAPSICQWVMWLINRDIDNRPDNARAALELLPRHPELAKEQVLQDVPVEKTGKVKLAMIKPVKEPVQGANVPKGLVTLPGGSTSLLTGGGGQAGASTKMLSGNRGPRERASAKSASADSGKKVLWGAVAVVVIFGAYLLAGTLATHHKKNQLNALSGRKNILPDPKVIELVLSFLYSEKSSLQERQVARDTLTLMTGSQVDGIILKKITEAPTYDARLTLCRILADRKMVSAVPNLIEAYKSAKSDSERNKMKELMLSLVATAKNSDTAAADQGLPSDEKEREEVLKPFLDKINSL